jgi:CubicO group peptidase (beta-lactamase class C family)
MIKQLYLTAALFINTLFIVGVTFSQQQNFAKLDSAILVADKLIETDPRVFFKNVESFIVYSRGKIMFEKYYNGSGKDSLHHIQSQTKSIVALLMGIAIDKGFVKSENEPVSRYFPEYFNTGDSVKSRVTIRDLLTMSAGFEWEEMLAFDDPKNDNMNMFRSGHWLRYALSRPMAKQPFTEFKYNSGCPMIVAAIIEQAAQMKLENFAQKYLFDPLGITTCRWQKDSTGFCHAGGGLFLKPLDMVKIGVMVMSKGQWENRQVVPENWYGYFWWVREMTTNGGKITKVITAEGAGGQKMYIFPEYKLVIAFTERNYSTPQVSPLFIKESVLKSLD